MSSPHLYCKNIWDEFMEEEERLNKLNTLLDLRADAMASEACTYSACSRASGKT
jgi:hypothetical protein